MQSPITWTIVTRHNAEAETYMIENVPFHLGYGKYSLAADSCKMITARFIVCMVLLFVGYRYVNFRDIQRTIHHTGEQYGMILKQLQFKNGNRFLMTEKESRK